LPSPTNKLEDVANALGWTEHDTGLSGREVAQRVRAWVNNPTTSTELDWERHKQYCNDDVNALEHVYTKIDDATRVDGQTVNTTLPDSTTQTGLSDY